MVEPIAGAGAGGERSSTPSEGGPGAAPSGSQIELPIAAGDGPPPGAELEALIEALLLVAPEPATVEELARGAGVSVAAIEQTLARLAKIETRGWVLIQHQGTVQMASAPRFAGAVRRFLRLERETRLSGPALEALAMIAYRQPLTRSEIEAVRGVDCAAVLATLHTRGLIEVAGRLETLGNPIQYATTPLFLQRFGLRSLADLPPLGEVEGRDADDLIEAALLDATPDAEVSDAPSG